MLFTIPLSVWQKNNCKTLQRSPADSKWYQADAWLLLAETNQFET